MNIKLTHRIIGFIVFAVEIVLLFSTVQPSVSFWDCGELSAASCALEVTHPPGAPFFILLNHLFTLLPLGLNIGFKVNMVTVISSSFSVLFCYLVSVRLIDMWKMKEKSNFDHLFIYIASAIGALSFGFANSFWFNGTESNVFGFSTFLFTLMIWLMMVWYEKADQKGSDRYLLLVALVLGLSPGVHLMSVLAGVTLGMIYVFRRIFTDDEQVLKSAKVFMLNVGILLVIALYMWSQETDATYPTREYYYAFDLKFKIIMIIVSIIVMGIFYKTVLIKNSFYWAFLAGFVINLLVYPGMVKYLPALMGHIGNNNLFVNLFILIAIVAVLGYLAFWSYQNKRHQLYLGSVMVVLCILGFSVYGYIIIRANQRPAMNENDPKDIQTLVSYLSREQYGEFPTFKRRFSGEPQHQVIWAKDQVTGKQNYSSDLDYFWNWQMYHMYMRYLLWNYIGRESWEQDAPWTWKQLYGIPFLIGLFGLFYLFYRDWKMGTIFLVTFIFMGFMICFYQNQQQMQPRDREYFYSGSWFVFSIWISIAIVGFYEQIKEKIKNINTSKILGYGVLAFTFMFIPLNMLRTNYPQENRSKNWIPWDYAYNLLQSCAPNAIIFTCGDNDTFPLWYLQDAEGFRTDVRIANLSLINTDWYIKGLKNDTPWGSQKVPISLTDAQIDKLYGDQVTPWSTRVIDIPVPENVFAEFGVKDTSLIHRGKISFTMRPTYGSEKQGGIRVQDVMVKEIIQQNRWQRPIYFAASCGSDNKIGLDNYLRLEGLAERLVPFTADEGYNIDTAFCNSSMLATDPVPNKNYQPGFIIRSFNNPDVYIDENQERVSWGYRNTYLKLTDYYASVLNNKDMALKVLASMEQKLPRQHVPFDYRIKYQVATLYNKAGDMNMYKQLLDEIIIEAKEKIDKNPRNISRNDNPYIYLKEAYEAKGDFENAIDVLNKMTMITGRSPDIQQEINRLTQLRDSSKFKK